MRELSENELIDDYDEEKNSQVVQSTAYGCESHPQ
jgi:hypothetical protein